MRRQAGKAGRAARRIRSRRVGGIARTFGRRSDGREQGESRHRIWPKRNLVRAVHPLRARKRHAERDDRDLLRFVRESSRAGCAGGQDADREVAARAVPRRWALRAAAALARRWPRRPMAGGHACHCIGPLAYWRAMSASAATSDEDLMLAYAAGEAAAFDTLYARHKGGVYRYLLRQCRDAGVAEQLFQDVWMNLIRVRATYQPSAKFTTWLYTLAHNRLIDHHRASGRVTLVSTDDESHADVVNALPASRRYEPESRASNREL